MAGTVCKGFPHPEAGSSPPRATMQTSPRAGKKVPDQISNE